MAGWGYPREGLYLLVSRCVSLCPAPTPIRYAEPFESPGDESHCFSSGHFTDGDGERSDIIWGQILEMLALDFGVAIIMNVL